MNKKLRIMTLVLGVIFGGAACTSTAAEESSDNKVVNESTEETILVGLRGDSPKVSYTDENGNFTGYEVEVFKALDEVLEDYQFEFVQTEFPSLFPSLQEGKIDIVGGNLRRSDEREQNYIHLTRSHLYMPYRIAVLGDNTTINSLDDLVGKKVGVGEGSLQAAILQTYMDNTGSEIELVYLSAADYPSSLEAGKIDAVIAPAFALEVYNDSYKGTDISFKAVGEVVESEEGIGSDSNAYFYLAKGNEDLRDELSDALYELRESGKLSEISSDFFLEDFPSQVDEEKEAEQINN